MRRIALPPKRWPFKSRGRRGRMGGSMIIWTGWAHSRRLYSSLAYGKIVFPRKGHRVPSFGLVIK
jgi:hypothetical protein